MRPRLKPTHQISAVDLLRSSSAVINPKGVIECFSDQEQKSCKRFRSSDPRFNTCLSDGKGELSVLDLLIGHMPSLERVALELRS